MTASELIEQLSQLPPDTDIVVMTDEGGYVFSAVKWLSRTYYSWEHCTVAAKTDLTEEELLSGQWWPACILWP